MTGAYGLRIRAVAPLPDLGAALSAWPDLHVEQRIEPGGTAKHLVEERRAVIVLAPDTHAEIDRAARTATLVSDRPWPAAAVVHPFLAAPAAVFAWWDGREPLHGGAFATRSGAWALLAAKGGGKSTTLAGLAAAGAPVVADDLVVVDGGTVPAGPRCVDLLPEAVAHLGVAATPEARRTKARMTLPPIAPEHPLCGVVHLGWGEEVALVPLPAAERLARLVASRSTWRDPSAPAAVLDLVALPTYELRRPQGLASLDAAVGLLMSL